MDKITSKINKLFNFKDDWKEVLTKAWSIRFIILSIIFQSIEILLPMYSEKFERGLFATLSILAAGLSFYSRLIAQKDI